MNQFIAQLWVKQYNYSFLSMVYMPQNNETKSIVRFIQKSWIDLADKRYQSIKDSASLASGQRA